LFRAFPPDLCFPARFERSNAEVGILMRYLGGAALALAIVLALGRQQAAWREAEIQRLDDIVRGRFDALALPPGSHFVYEELEVSRDCKTATLTRLFAADADPAGICEAVFQPMRSAGWKSFAGCRNLTYPMTPASVDGGRPSYPYSMLEIGESRFRIGLNARPRDAWGYLFMLSSFGEREAVPLAKKAGESIFTVSLHYREETAPANGLRPGTRPRDCAYSSRSEQKFASGRPISR
jgi:hypothetical protein